MHRLILVCLLALLVPASGAAASGGWTQVSSEDKSNTDDPSLALAGAQVVGAWPLALGASETAETVTFTPTPSAAGVTASLKRSDAVTGWASLGATRLLGSTGPGALQLMLSGGGPLGGGANPLNGTSFAARNADGSWAAPAPTGLANSASSGSSVSAVAGPDSQTPLFVQSYGGGLVVFHGSSGLTTGVDVGASQLGGNVEGAGATLARDTAGHYWLAWYNAKSSNLGVYVLQIDPSSGAPIGSAMLAPSSSTNSNFGQDQFQIECAASCRLIYHGTTGAGADSGGLLTWWPGDAAPVAVSGAASKTGSWFGGAYTPDGRLWITWWDGTSVRAVLGDGRGAGGTPQLAGTPTAGGTPYHLQAIAAPDGSLVIAVNWLAGSSFAMWVRDVPAPGGVYSGPTQETSQTVGATVLTLVTPKACVAAGSKIIARLFVKASKVKKRVGGPGHVVVIVGRVDFSVDGKVRSRVKHKPFAATLVLNGLQPGSTHQIAAKAYLLSKSGPQRTRTIKVKFKIC